MQAWTGSLWVTGMSTYDMALIITQRTLKLEGTVQYIIIIITSVLFFTIFLIPGRILKNQETTVDINKLTHAT